MKKRTLIINDLGNVSQKYNDNQIDEVTLTGWLNGFGRDALLKIYDDFGFFFICFKSSTFDKCYSRSDINKIYDEIDRLFHQ